MKKLFFPLLAASIVCVIACSKNNDPAKPAAPPVTTIGLLQNIWLLDSINVYTNRGFAGNYFFGYKGNGIDNYNFRSNGKLYAFAVSTFDTANYTLLPDDSTLYIYEIRNGVPAQKPDTAYIRTLTRNSLIFATQNPAHEWGKFVFKRQ